MELRFQAGGPESWSADAVIVFLSEDEKLEKAYPELLDAAPWMSIAPGMRDFHGKKGEMGLLYGPPAHPLSRAVVVGLGKLDALTYAETLEEIRKGAGAAAVRCRELGVDTLALPVSGLARFNADVERTIEEIVCAAMLGLWRNKAFKSKEPEDADPRWLALLFCDANVPDFPRLAARRGAHVQHLVSRLHRKTAGRRHSAWFLQIVKARKIIWMLRRRHILAIIIESILNPRNRRYLKRADPLKFFYRYLGGINPQAIVSWLLVTVYIFVKLFLQESSHLFLECTGQIHYPSSVSKYFFTYVVKYNTFHGITLGICIL